MVLQHLIVAEKVLTVPGDADASIASGPTRIPSVYPCTPRPVSVLFAPLIAGLVFSIFGADTLHTVIICSKPTATDHITIFGYGHIGQKEKEQK